MNTIVAKRQSKEVVVKTPSSTMAILIPKKDTINVYSNTKRAFLLNPTQSAGSRAALDSRYLQLLEDHIKGASHLTEGDRESIARNYKNLTELYDSVFDKDGYFTDRIRPLSIETKYLTVGSKIDRLTLVGVTFSANVGGSPNACAWTSGIIWHFALPDDAGATWQLKAGSYTIPDDNLCYIYATAPKSRLGEATLDISKDKKATETESSYNILLGVVHSVIDGYRDVTFTYGQTTIVGENITSGTIRGNNGNGLIINLNTGEIAGKITLLPGSPALTAIKAAEDAAEKASTSVSELNTYVDGAFKDGVISEAEAKAIEKYKAQITANFNDVIATYNIIYSNAYLEGTAKSDLLNAKVTLAGAKDNLLGSITTAISDGKTTQAEKNDVDAKYALWDSALSTYKSKLEAANKAIQDKLKSYSDIAAQDAANAKQQLVDMASDGILSPVEKKDLVQRYNNIISEQVGIDAEAANIGITTEKEAYDSAIAALTAYLNTLTSPVAWSSLSGNTAIDKAVFSAKFNAVYAARQVLFNRLYRGVKDTAEQNAKDAVAKNLGYADFDELNDKAIAGETILEGGKLRNNMVDTDALFAQQISAKNMIVLAGKVGDFEIASKLIGSGYTNGVLNGNQIILDPSNNEVVLAKNGVKRVRLTNNALTPLSELKADGGTVYCTNASAAPVKKTSTLALQASRNDIGVGGAGLSHTNAVGIVSNTPTVYNTIDEAGKVVLQPAFYSLDFPYVMNIVHSGDARDGRYNRIIGKNTCKVQVSLVSTSGIVSSYNDEFEMSVDTYDTGNSIAYNRMARFNFSVSSASKYWVVSTFTVVGSDNPIHYQSYNHATTFRHSWWSNENDWDVQYELTVASGMSIDGSIGMTELSNSGFQSVWTDHRFIRIDGNTNNPTFIESEGVWKHNGIEVKFDTATITGFIDPTKFASKNYVDDGFYTKSASDGRYLSKSSTSQQVVNSPIQFVGQVQINGDIVQNGTAYETHAQHVFTANDFMTLRDGAVTNLADGSYTGFQSKRVFADGSDGFLVFGSDGMAKVGKQTSLQMLATREDAPTDGAIQYYNAANKRLTSGVLASDLWHKGNSNLPTVDWSAKRLLAFLRDTNKNTANIIGNWTNSGYYGFGQVGENTVGLKGCGADGVFNANANFLVSGSLTANQGLSVIGNATLNHNTKHYLRSGAVDSYNGGFYYDTYGYEALLIGFKNPNTRIKFKTGLDFEGLAANSVTGMANASLDIGSADVKFGVTVQSYNYSGSGFTATGWGITADGDANFRNHTVRGKLTTYEFVQNKISIANGNMIVSDNAKCTSTYRWVDGGAASLTGVHRRWLFTEPHPFNTGDVLRCKSNGKDYQFTVDWIGTDRTFVDCYNCSGSLGDIPSNGDFLVRWNSNDAARKGLLYLCSSDAGSPNYQVIYDNAVKAQFGNLEGRTWMGSALPANTWGLWAENAYLSGAVNAISGKIGNFTISGNNLYAGNAWTTGAGVQMMQYADGGSFRAYRDTSNYAMLYNYSANDWGITGVKDGKYLFKIGSENYIAGGAISWDAAGNVTFADSVKLQWQSGGRNYAPNSKETTIASSSHNYNFFTIPYYLETNTVYTFSAEASVVSGSISEYTIRAYDLTNDIGGPYSTFTVGSRGKFTFTSPNSSLFRIIVSPGVAGATANKSLKLIKYKIEKGYNATDWTPALEDVDNKLTRITSDGVYAGNITANQIDGDFINGKTINAVNASNTTIMQLHGANGTLTGFDDSGVMQSQLSRGSLTFFDSLGVPAVFLRNSTISLSECKNGGSIYATSAGSIAENGTAYSGEFSISTLGAYKGTIPMSLSASGSIEVDGHNNIVYTNVNCSVSVHVSVDLEWKNPSTNLFESYLKGVAYASAYSSTNTTSASCSSSAAASLGFTASKTGTFRLKFSHTNSCYGNAWNSSKSSAYFDVIVISLTSTASNTGSINGSKVSNGTYIGTNGFVAYNAESGEKYLAFDNSQYYALSSKANTCFASPNENMNVYVEDESISIYASGVKLKVTSGGRIYMYGVPGAEVNVNGTGAKRYRLYLDENNQLCKSPNNGW